MRHLFWLLILACGSQGSGAPCVTSADCPMARCDCGNGSGYEAYAYCVKNFCTDDSEHCGSYCGQQGAGGGAGGAFNGSGGGFNGNGGGFNGSGGGYSGSGGGYSGSGGGYSGSGGYGGAGGSGNPAMAFCTTSSSSNTCYCATSATNSTPCSTSSVGNDSECCATTSWPSGGSCQCGRFTCSPNTGGGHDCSFGGSGTTHSASNTVCCIRGAPSLGWYCGCYSAANACDGYQKVSSCTAGVLPACSGITTLGDRQVASCR